MVCGLGLGLGVQSLELGFRGRGHRIEILMNYGFKARLDRHFDNQYICIYICSLTICEFADRFWSRRACMSCARFEVVMLRSSIDRVPFVTSES